MAEKTAYMQVSALYEDYQVSSVFDRPDLVCRRSWNPYYDGDRLVYAGKVGTGFNNRTLTELSEQMRTCQQRRSPFVGEVRERGALWIRSELVTQISFTEWTSEGKLRHPRYLGLRDDKSPAGSPTSTPPRRMIPKLVLVGRAGAGDRRRVPMIIV